MQRKTAYVVHIALALAFVCPGLAQTITVTKARIGCLDIQTDGNLTGLVGQSCNGKTSCSYKAPTEDQYKRAGVKARTRSFCTQGMEITYRCGPGEFHTVNVPGDAWNHPPAQLACTPAVPPPSAHTPKPDAITVSRARIGCLDIQTAGNLTALVARACDDKASCSYKAPTEQQYRQEGVQAATRPFCTQGMEITYQCGHNDFQTVLVPGDAWDHPPAQLICNAPPVTSNQPLPPGAGPITVTKARIGCLDIQTTGNLTRLVSQACNDRLACSYQAPTEDAYKRAGVQAATRTLCTQGMEITYRCGENDDQVITVPGDAWNHPPAQLVCNGTTVATNRQDVTPPTQGSASEPACSQARLEPPDPDYVIAPRDMLDWTPTDAHQDLIAGFSPPSPATPAMYNSPLTSSIPGAPGSTLGANEGRVRAELIEVARKQDPIHALCQAAQRFTRNRPAAAGTPSDQEFGNAFADLSVTGRHAFETFTRLHPNEAVLRGQAECSGAAPAALTKALTRAYQVANALRLPHASPQRKALGWIAVSGENDQPYRPVNVPSTNFPQFQIRVVLPKQNIAVDTRYMIAHARNAPAFQRPAVPLVDGGPAYRVPADPLPALAPDAQVILFIHGMDSKLEEAEDLTAALHRLGGKNWTVISMDLPTSGYATNINHQNVSPISQVQCHNTPLVDFIEDFIVAFVDTLDGQLHGQLKPKVRAVVGGSLGGNMAMRLGRRPNTPWITAVVPWSPAAIWPSYIAQHHAVAAGCDTGWDAFKDKAVNQSLDWAGLDEEYLPKLNEPPGRRRELFYGGFDWSPVGGLGGPPQAQCWYSGNYKCKQSLIRSSRMDRQETYDTNFRAWHWRLGAEQLAFSQQLFAPGTNEPLYLKNNKRMLLLTGYDDTCADLGKYTRDVSSKMVNTPGYARFLKQTGHSLDNEHPEWVARQIIDFLR